MSDLDKRLHEIAADIYRHITAEEGGDWLSANEDMEAIKQAFTDAGYVPTDVKEKADEFLQDIMNLQANMKHDALRLSLTTTPKKPKLFKDMESMAREHGYMTSQEWYQKFKAEMDEVEYDGKDDMRRGFYRNSTVTYAAKRAAGLTE